MVPRTWWRWHLPSRGRADVPWLLSTPQLWLSARPQTSRGAEGVVIFGRDHIHLNLTFLLSILMVGELLRLGMTLAECSNRNFSLLKQVPDSFNLTSKPSSFIPKGREAFGNLLGSLPLAISVGKWKLGIEANEQR